MVSVTSSLLFGILNVLLSFIDDVDGGFDDDFDKMVDSSVSITCF